MLGWQLTAKTCSVPRHVRGHGRGLTVRQLQSESHHGPKHTGQQGRSAADEQAEAGNSSRRQRAPRRCASEALLGLLSHSAHPSAGAKSREASEPGRLHARLPTNDESPFPSA